MLALLALVCFVLALLNVDVQIDLVVLGFAFVTAHLVFGTVLHGPGRSGRRP